MQLLLDKVTHLLGGGAASMSARLATLHTVSLWSLTYVFSLGLMYLFHSPFRAHTASRTDWYAQLTKVLQVWLAVVVVFFHIAPSLLRTGGAACFARRAATAAAADAACAVAVVGDESGTALVFFPVFSTLSMAFLLLHKVKRRFQLGVTYGPSLTVVLLNSILLSVFTLVHYAACWEVTGFVRAARESDARGQSGPLSRLRPPTLATATVALRLVCPANDVLVHPFTTIAHLILVNFLFIALDYRYKARRGFDPTRGLLFSELYNARRGVGPVDVLEAARCTGAPAAPRRPAPSSSWWWSWWWWHLTRNEQRLREAYRAYDARYAEPTPTRVAARRPRGGRTVALIGASGGGGGGGGGGLLAHPSSISPSSPHLDATAGVEKAGFPLSPAEAAELTSARHPDNKAGMVPWFSTFILGTTWQSAAYGALDFLVFDARLLQDTLRPRAFDLRFHATLPELNAARERAQRAVGSDGQTKSGAPESLTGESPEDVWFDWIADVGDGFNSTYEMARLVAQPMLHVSNKARRWSRARSASSPSPSPSPSSPSPSRSPLLRPATSALKSAPTAALSPDGRVEDGDDAVHSLPRASFLLVGGDLAYPNPSDETYLSRFIGPYNDALRGHRRMQELLNAQRDSVVEQDTTNADLARVHMLSAGTVAMLATGTGPSGRVGSGTVEEAVRSVPLLFAIPGNHEWLDGLTTFRKFILERRWLGGWFMPQRTSYFVLKLPLNWFILCTDCGTQKDINPTQLNYFLEAIETYMDEASCVVLTSHEPGWIYDAMLRKDRATQPELNRLAMALGTRLRVWIAGDIHHYSRHIPQEGAMSEAPQLVVSGGGGAFLHGPRSSAVIHQGTEYVRAAAFPYGNTYMTLLSRLIGFRLINWKFDLIVGVSCFVVVLSMLPQPYNTAHTEDIRDISGFADAWADLTGTLVEYIFAKGVVSLWAVLFFLSCFSSAGGENGAPLVLRLLHGGLWTALVVLSCCGMLAYLECVLSYMANNGMLLSAGGKWGCVLDEQVRLTTDAFLNHTWKVLGSSAAPVRALRAAQHRLYGSRPVQLFGTLMRCLDPVETLAYLSVKVSSRELHMGTTSPDATRTEVVLYYCNFLFFYWILVTPLVSFLIGSFLLVSATLFDCFYDPAYSAFQIEDYKHFIRFRLDARTRELHGYVVVEKKVPKVWELDDQHVDEACGRGGQTPVASEDMPPPHLWRHPSRWRSSISPDIDPAITTVGERLFPFLRRRRARPAAVRGKPEVLEHFVCRPHTGESAGDDPVSPAVSEPGS